jgi:hypothetical protein
MHLLLISSVLILERFLVERVGGGEGEEGEVRGRGGWGWEEGGTVWAEGGEAGGGEGMVAGETGCWWCWCGVGRV